MSETLNLARFKKASDTFELVVHPDKAVYFKKHPDTDVRDALVYPKVYSDAKKGLLASEQKLQAVFGTTEPLDIAKQILTRGEIQVTAEYRKQQLDQKKAHIVELIRRQGVDPRTNAPHPPARIEAAMDEAKVRIDTYLPAEQQVQDILKQLRPIIPIKMVTKDIEVVLPAQHAGRAYPAVKQFGKILKDHWQSDGSWTGVVEIPGGLENDFYDKLNSLTSGGVQTKLLVTKGE